MATPAPGAPRRPAAARSLIVLAVPVIVYFAIRPSVHSDAAGLAIAGAVPMAYSVLLVLWRQRIDLLALMTSLGLALACLGSLMAGGNSLPLKLHEAAVTFILGVGLLAAVLIRRPLPVGRYLKIPQAGPQQDAMLSVLVGGFLVLHAMLHLVLAVTLSTAVYLTLGRVVNLATLGVGAACLYGSLHRARRHAPPTVEHAQHAPRRS
jgi:hypothetical protein